MILNVLVIYQIILFNFCSFPLQPHCLIHALLKAQKKLSSFTAMPSSASSRHVSKSAGVWDYGGSSSSI